MDTNLKASKKFRAFLYRIIAVGALFTMIATVAIGREAFVNLYKEGTGTIKGSIYYLTEFREYMSTLYSQAMLGYAGAGDDNGYPLTGNNANMISMKAKSGFGINVAKASEDLIYYIDYRGVQKAINNITLPLFSEYDSHLLLSEDVRICCYWNGPDSSLQFFAQKTTDDLLGHSDRYYRSQYSPNASDAAKVRVLLAIPDTDTYKSEYFQQLAIQAQNYSRILMVFIISSILFIIFTPCSFITTRAGKEALQDYAGLSSKIWFEIKLALIIAALAFCFNLHLWHFDGSMVRRLGVSDLIWIYFPVGIILYLFFTDILINKQKALKSSFVYTLWQYIKEFFTGLPWKRKAMLLHFILLLLAVSQIITGCVFLYKCNYSFCIALFIIAILLFIASLFIRRFIKDTEALAIKLSKVQSGQFGEPLVLGKHSLLKEAAADINSVEDGIEAAVEESNRAGKMRVELITNVSHDLKTPLTSIINYADLLVEENLPAPADEYASLLRNKAYRLKSMVQDVFEISKATSGNLPVEIVQLDLAKLIRQTLADMDERIQESTLTFKLNIAEEPLMINADGEKLYRVFQNLIINALQYSLENSRVHILLTAEESYACAKIKNISKQDLDFDPKEIVERFVRADASRTTEGSGLGLSIVQSFTEACGGTFCVETDADMFTATVRFPLI